MIHENWQGKWIDAGSPVECRTAPIFKRDFILNSLPKRAEIAICGLGIFELRVNGMLPDDSLLNPRQTQYSMSAVYRMFDIASLLRVGENCVTVELGCGFYNETTEVWLWHAAAWRAAPKLICDILLHSDEDVVIPSDESWLVTLDGETVANSIYCGETYDARRGINMNWQPAKLAAAPNIELRPDNVPPIRRVDSYKPKAIERLANGAQIITAPEMLAGWARLRIDAPRDAEIVITYGEQLKDDGQVVRTGRGEGPCHEWWPNATIQQDRFISDGSPRIFEPKFSYKGFRYIQIDGLTQDLTEEDIDLYRVANDIKVISEFTCSDERLNKLHEIMRRTMRNNFQWKPTDTPVWEKNGWLGDANCALDTMFCNFDMGAFMESFLDIMTDCFHEFGDVPVMVPSANWSTANSPVWNTIYVFACEMLYDRCGRLDYAEEHYADLHTFAMKAVSDIEAQGLVWDPHILADWVSPTCVEDDPDMNPMPSEGSSLCVAAYIYAMLRSMVRIASLLGREENIPLYRAAMDKLYTVFNEQYYNAELGIYETDYWMPCGKRTKYRQTSNLLPLAFGLVPEEHRTIVAENLLADVKAKDYHLDTGCVGTRLILPVLHDLGYEDAAFRVLTQNTYPSWCYWLELGHDSAWESWEKTTRSLDHYFLGTYDEYFYSHIAGIREVRDGYRRFTAAPAISLPLEHAMARIETPLGIASCAWKKEGNTVRVEICVPDGAEATIKLGEECFVKCGGVYSFILRDGKII